jgi:hypothetical protein
MILNILPTSHGTLPSVRSRKPPTRVLTLADSVLYEARSSPSPRRGRDADDHQGNNRQARQKRRRLPRNSVDYILTIS